MGEGCIGLTDLLTGWVSVHTDKNDIDNHKCMYVHVGMAITQDESPYDRLEPT